ncbi:type VI secretion system protein VasD [Pseudomonas delhiensis]|uniref:Type VI secretion system protein VasD n=1 Tax=Pseudomonas delhiensis TaxID=366289 RepID=A0A239M1X1_9PSED|nr:type VI secretion system lipoprotein TssJ [Pseudomonas delhiensis]SDJ39219.1 type VI secretion system protein VasD [Pseudomonas delhiensis]SNT36716.1 type VI secretion system protein VasD [Pseudomonas delhiensis]
MSLTVFRTLLAMAALGLALGGCGVAQRVAEGGSSLAQGIFYKQVKVLRLDFSGRAALNTDARDMSGLSVSTLVRVYQLRSREAFDRASYQALLGEGAEVLANDLLEERQVVVKPGEGAQLSMPLVAEAKFVAVVGLFRAPGADDARWRLVLVRDELDPDRARLIELSDSTLNLLPLAEKDA